DFFVPNNSAVIGQPIVEIGLPDDCTIILINRNDELIVPSGSSELKAGDTILVIVKKKNFDDMRRILSTMKKTE
ncbi:MAG: potassium/proton antiporter, partial [Bacteroidetes bacterium]